MFENVVNQPSLLIYFSSKRDLLPIAIISPFNQPNNSNQSSNARSSMNFARTFTEQKTDLNHPKLGCVSARIETRANLKINDRWAGGLASSDIDVPLRNSSQLSLKYDDDAPIYSCFEMQKQASGQFSSLAFERGCYVQGLRYAVVEHVIFKNLTYRW